jgi:hypothetical protein
MGQKLPISAIKLTVITVALPILLCARSGGPPAGVTGVSGGETLGHA